MQLKELEEKFPVGSIVAVGGDGPRFEALLTAGLTGIVKLLDESSGVCVALHVSRIFTPCFWFEAEVIVRIPERSVWVPDAEGLERIIGGRNNPVPNASGMIALGCLRSWLIAKSRARAGSILETTIMGMPWDAIAELFANGIKSTQWLIENDTRPRRPVMVEAETSASFGNPMNPKRPRMGV